MQKKTPKTNQEHQTILKSKSGRRGRRQAPGFLTLPGTSNEMGRDGTISPSVSKFGGGKLTLHWEGKPTREQTLVRKGKKLVVRIDL